MRASSTATSGRSGVGAWAACGRAACATASSVGMGSTGTPPGRAATARPCTTEQAVRSPVNEPGPWPNAMASSPASVQPTSANRPSNRGSSSADAWAPPGPLYTASGSPPAGPRARLRRSVLVSRASTFWGREAGVWFIVQA